MATIRISDWTIFPGGRYKVDGDYSGEKYREEVLIPFIKENQGDEILIDLDGTFGFATSFLDEAIGKLVYHFEPEVIDNIIIKTEDQTSLQSIINEYIESHRDEIKKNPEKFLGL